MTHLSIFFGLTLANFAYQLFTKQQYNVAFERTFFQGFAIFMCWGNL